MLKTSILAISGDFCAGKNTLCKFFEENYKFKYINLSVFKLKKLLTDILIIKNLGRKWLQWER